MSGSLSNWHTDVDAARERVIDRHGGDQSLLGEDQVIQTRCLMREAKEGNICRAIRQPRRCVIKVKLPHLDLDIGEALAEHLQHERSEFKGRGNQEAHLETTALAFGRELRRADCLVERRDRNADVHEELRPGGTQSDTVWMSDQELQPEFPLQLADLSGERRLGDLEPARRPGEVAFLSDGYEVAEFL